MKFNKLFFVLVFIFIFNSPVLSVDYVNIATCPDSFSSSRSHLSTQNLAEMSGLSKYHDLKSDDGWIMYEFPDKYPIDKFEIGVDTDTKAPNQIQFQASNDLNEWINIISFNDVEWNTQIADYDILVFYNGVMVDDYKYYRIQMQNDLGNDLKINQVRMFVQEDLVIDKGLTAELDFENSATIMMFIFFSILLIFTALFLNGIVGASGMLLLAFVLFASNTHILFGLFYLLISILLVLYGYYND